MFRFGKFPESDALKRFVVVAVMLVALVGMVYVPPLVSVGNTPLWRGTGMDVDAIAYVPRLGLIYREPDHSTWELVRHGVHSELEL